MGTISSTGTINLNKNLIMVDYLACDINVILPTPVYIQTVCTIQTLYVR